MSKTLQEQYEVVLSPEGIHYELASGLHGRKLDFEKIADGSLLFDQTIQAAKERIEHLYKYDVYGKLALLGVANGANRFVVPLAASLGIPGLITDKKPDKSIVLSAEAEDFIGSDEYDWVVIFDDVGTQGTNSSMVVHEVRRVKPKAKLSVLNMVQRSQTLPLLTAIGARYDHVLYWPLPSFAPDECQTNPAGFCSQGWELIEK